MMIILCFILYIYIKIYIRAFAFFGCFSPGFGPFFGDLPDRLLTHVKIICIIESVNRNSKEKTVNRELRLLPAENPETPLYIQIADRLRALIDNRTLRPGDKIPPTRELRSRFNVSTITVEAGLKLLVEQKYLVRRPRRGTFVNPELERQNSLTPAPRLAVRIVFGGIDLNDRYWYIVLNALESAPKLAEADKLFSRLRTSEPDRALIDGLADNCNGLILCGYTPQPLIDRLQEQEVPFAMIGGLNSGAPAKKEIDAVMHDDIHRAFLSTRHLLDLDHRRICCVAGPAGSRLAEDIATGYRAALREYNLSAAAEQICPVAKHTIEAGFDAGLRLLTGNNRPSAVFACDDRLAVGVAKAAFHLGFRIPDDLSLIGCGNQEVGKILSPELTTTPSYPERSAEIAVEKLLGQLRNPQHRKSRTVLQIEELVIGGSTRIWRPPAEPAEPLFTTPGKLTLKPVAHCFQYKAKN